MHLIATPSVLERFVDKYFKARTTIPEREPDTTMNELERLQAAIAEHKRRWTEKYGWVSPEECRHPTMEEEMRREVEAQWTREASACIRMIIAKAQKAAAEHPITEK